MSYNAQTIALEGATPIYNSGTGLPPLYFSFRSELEPDIHVLFAVECPP